MSKQIASLAAQLKLMEEREPDADEDEAEWEAAAKERLKEKLASKKRALVAQKPGHVQVRTLEQRVEKLERRKKRIDERMVGIEEEQAKLDEERQTLGDERTGVEVELEMVSEELSKLHIDIAAEQEGRRGNGDGRKAAPDEVVRLLQKCMPCGEGPHYAAFQALLAQLAEAAKALPRPEETGGGAAGEGGQAIDVPMGDGGGRAAEPPSARTVAVDPRFTRLLGAGVSAGSREALARLAVQIVIEAVGAGGAASAGQGGGGSVLALPSSHPGGDGGDGDWQTAGADGRAVKNRTERERSPRARAGASDI